jgi:NADH dehydrogenase [ubiquinone] 1 alpha subcomplex assembly factor 5
MSITEIFSSEKLLLHKLRSRNHFENHNFLFEISANIIKDRIEFLEKNPLKIFEYNNGETFIFADYFQKNFSSTEYCIGSLSKDLNNKATYSINPEDLQLKADSFNLIIANLNLHWINNLPGFLKEVQKSLQNNGTFIGTCFGRNTLKELKQSIYMTQNELGLPFSHHISPFISSEDGANLLHKAGFTFKVADYEELNVSYSNFKSLLYDLRGMGETNNMALTLNPFNKRFLTVLEKNYYANFANADNELSATYELIILNAVKI